MKGLEVYGGFPKLGRTILRVPIIRIMPYWGLYWGPIIYGNYHIGVQRKSSKKNAIAAFGLDGQKDTAQLKRAHRQPFKRISREAR